MNKDLHDIDDLFRSELDAYEEAPSPGIKESLDAALDKRDAESNKKRFIGWKRITPLLLLLLTGFVLYESGILKKGHGLADEKTAGKQMNYPFVEKHKKNYQNNIVTDNTNNDDAGSYNKEAVKNNVDNTNKTVTGDGHILIQPNQKEMAAPVITGINNKAGFKESPSEDKIVVQKTNPEKEQSNSLTGDEKKATSGIQPNPDKNMNFPETKDPLPKEKINPLQSPKEISTTKLATGFANSIKQSKPVNDSLLINSTTKNRKEKSVKIFKPFWMITAFGSYERAGYRLDSDFPTNITNIKHSEIHEPSFSLGVLTTRQLKKQWGLQTGLVYSQTDIGISPQKLYALQNPVGDISFKYITSSGSAYIKPGLGAPPSIGDSLITTEGKHRLKFISVPLAVKYSVGKNKLSFIPGVGLEANFLTSAKVETELESPSNPEIIFINKLDGAKPFYLSVVADAELRYKLNNKLSLSFRPAIRFATSPVTKNNVVETFPRSVGVGVGLTWKF